MTTIAKKRRTALAFSAFAVVVAAAVAGCTEKDDPNAAASSAPREGFGKCMRDAGFAWYPDEDGTDRLGADPPAGAVVDEQKLQKAQQACAEKGMNGGGNAPAAASAEDIAKMRAYAKCLRENGLPTVPDPGANGIIDFRKAKVQDDTPEWKRATEACQKFLPQPKDRRNEGNP